ncbi:hypothetical protein [Novosphingobium sp. UBA1939]|uniref:hypothetical protein n=1 Tax=Novosphingobium sp. UBA1939 TaxID=1946982 RepID=UPI0025D62709|nr:hypothetical protein [Novosphingobium sp. UBA1939]
MFAALALVLMGQGVAAAGRSDIEAMRIAERQKALAAWESCTLGNASRLARGNAEPAATIADAALGLCADGERDYRRWTNEIVKVLDNSWEYANQQTATMRNEVRGRAIAAVIEQRSKAPTRRKR